MIELPQFLLDRLHSQYGTKLVSEILEGYQSKRPVTFRINRLKTTVEEIEKVLEEEAILFKKVDWYPDAFLIEGKSEEEIRKLAIYEEGKIYLQSLSSMLPVLFLELKEGTSILDMAAAPGGKTTQISSISQDKVLITACEKNKIRADRLRYNIKKQGARRVTVLEKDASKLDAFFSFDEILLDAPCSGSGTLQKENDNSYFREELIEKTKKLQRELLRKAIQVLKPGATMIYSTCSILEEENELSIKSFLESQQVEVVSLETSLFKDISFLPSKVEGAIVVKPTSLYEGFFICKLRKK